MDGLCGMEAKHHQSIHLAFLLTKWPYGSIKVPSVTGFSIWTISFCASTVPMTPTARTPSLYILMMEQGLHSTMCTHNTPKYHTTSWHDSLPPGYSPPLFHPVRCLRLRAPLVHPLYCHCHNYTTSTKTHSHTQHTHTHNIHTHTHTHIHIHTHNTHKHTHNTHAHTNKLQIWELAIFVCGIARELG